MAPASSTRVAAQTAPVEFRSLHALAREASARQTARGAAPPETIAFLAARDAPPGAILEAAAQARWLQFHMRAAEAREACARAVQLAEQATARERRHVEIYSRLVGGDPRGALAATREHLADFPRDAMALAPAPTPAP